MSLVEEVEESDTPAPSAAHVEVRSPQPGSWLCGLFSGGAASSPTSTQVRRLSPAEDGLDEDEDVDDGWTSDEEDSYGDDVMGTFQISRLRSSVCCAVCQHWLG